MTQYYEYAAMLSEEIMRHDCRLDLKGFPIPVSVWDK
jgi:hypothetical protein